MADTFTEENMKTLIKEIFQEEFKKQAENFGAEATLELRKDLIVEVKRLRELRKIAYLNDTTTVSREKVEE